MTPDIFSDYRLNPSPRNAKLHLLYSVACCAPSPAASEPPARVLEERDVAYRPLLATTTVHVSPPQWRCLATEPFFFGNDDIWVQIRWRRGSIILTLWLEEIGFNFIFSPSCYEASIFLAPKLKLIEKVIHKVSYSRLVGAGLDWWLAECVSCSCYERVDSHDNRLQFPFSSFYHWFVKAAVLNCTLNPPKDLFLVRYLTYCDSVGLFKDNNWPVHVTLSSEVYFRCSLYQNRYNPTCVKDNNKKVIQFQGPSDPNEKVMKSIKKIKKKKDFGRIILE